LNRHKKKCKLVVDEYYTKVQEEIICDECGKKYIDKKSFIKHDKKHKEMREKLELKSVEIKEEKKKILIEFN
jgi:hypothetical protein